MRISPLAGFHQLTNFALHQIPLQRADVANVELAIQVVGFVAEGARQQFFARVFEKFAFCVLRPHGYFLRPGYVFAKFRNAEAAFVLRDAALGVNDLRIDENEFLLWVFLERDINDRNAPSNTDLGCGEANSVRGVHGFEHIVDKLAQAGVKLRYGSGLGLENWVAQLNNGIDHGVANSSSTAQDSRDSCATFRPWNRRQTYPERSAPGSAQPWILRPRPRPAQRKRRSAHRRPPQVDGSQSPQISMDGAAWKSVSGTRARGYLPHWKRPPQCPRRCSEAE